MKTLEAKIKYAFKQGTLLKTALTHPSYLNEHPQADDSYQRLEFLGDAVLEYLASICLFTDFPQIREGRLTEIRSALVRTESLAKIAQKLKLGDFLFLSKGEETNHGRENENILADTVEALLAAIYLDSSINQAKLFFDSFIKPELDIIVKEKLYLDAKTQLQEYLQAKYKKTPNYRLIKKDDAETELGFKIGVFLNESCLGFGYGKNKRLAEQMAAKNALGKINNL